jgi:hypothetical protein
MYKLVVLFRTGISRVELSSDDKEYLERLIPEYYEYYPPNIVVKIYVEEDDGYRPPTIRLVKPPRT